MTASAQANQPKRKGRHSLRRKLAVTMILVALTSVAVLGVLNYIQVRDLLTEQVEEQLTIQGQARARAISNGLQDIEDNVTVLARDAAVKQALVAFSAAYQDLLDQPQLLEPAEIAAVEDFYRETVAQVYTDKGVDPPPLADMLPTEEASQYLQYHYIVTNPFPAGERDELITAEGDTSAYRLTHEEHHPVMRQVPDNLRFGDLLLIDLDTTVVYTVEKRIDFAANLTTGLGSDSALARAIIEKITAAPLGTAVLNDFDFYVPKDGAPVMFAAAAVRDEGEPIGAVAVTIPIEGLNDIMTAQGQWQDTGFGSTGESYVVGSDLTMRSDARLWLEDPEAFAAEFAAAGYPAELADFIAAFDSTVLLQPVDTEAVDIAFDGETFIGSTTNYLNQRTLTVAEPVGFEDVSWVIVSDLAWSEAKEAVNDYTRRLLITAAILLPAVGLLGLLLADRMTRPVEPVVVAAEEVAAGDLATEVPDLGRNEYGDVGRRINTFTADLRAQHEALTEEAHEVEKLLRSALPDRIVRQIREQDRHLEDLADTATVIALTATGSLVDAGVDQDWTTQLGTRLSTQLEIYADDLGIERVRSAGSSHIFAAGLGDPDVAAEAAAEFALAACAFIEEMTEEANVDVTYHAGLSSGSVIAGLLSASQITYGVFGDPPRTAMALDSIAPRAQILVDASTADELGSDWILEQTHDLLDLRGEPVTAQVLVGRRRAQTEPTEGT